MGNSATLCSEVSTNHKLLTTATNLLFTNTTSVFSAASDFLVLAQKIEQWSQKLLQKEEELLKREKQVIEKDKDLEAESLRLCEREKRLKEREQKVQDKEVEWKKMQERLEKNAANLQTIIQLNVGGQYFEVPKATLFEFEGTYFESMLTADRSQVFSNRFFIDANPTYFHEILDFLRTKRISRAFVEKQSELREQFEFYKLPFPQLCLATLPAPIPNWFPERSFSLMYKASRDGFGKDTFHKICDNRGPTLALIQSSKGYLFGGYAPIPWGVNTGRDVINSDFVLFTLTNPHGILPTQYKLQEGKSASHYSRGDVHVSFGEADLRVADCDANMNSESYSFFGQSYNDTTGKGFATFTGDSNFKISEIEVYLVI